MFCKYYPTSMYDVISCEGYCKAGGEIVNGKICRESDESSCSFFLVQTEIDMVREKSRNLKSQLQSI